MFSRIKKNSILKGYQPTGGQVPPLPDPNREPSYRSAGAGAYFAVLPSHLMHNCTCEGECKDRQGEVAFKKPPRGVRYFPHTILWSLLLEPGQWKFGGARAVNTERNISIWSDESRFTLNCDVPAYKFNRKERRLIRKAMDKAMAFNHGRSVI